MIETSLLEAPCRIMVLCNSQKVAPHDANADGFNAPQGQRQQTQTHTPFAFPRNSFTDVNLVDSNDSVQNTKITLKLNHIQPVLSYP